jgi:hypothetical protein
LEASAVPAACRFEAIIKMRFEPGFALEIPANSKNYRTRKTPETQKTPRLEKLLE